MFANSQLYNSTGHFICYKERISRFANDALLKPGPLRVEGVKKIGVGAEMAAS